MSKDITVGPTAIMSLLVADYGRPLDAADADLNDPTYAVLLAFFTGVIQIGMGILHLGQYRLLSCCIDLGHVPSNHK